MASPMPVGMVFHLSVDVWLCLQRKLFVWISVLQAEMAGLVFRCPTAFLFTELVFCSPRSASWVQVPWDIGADPAESFEDLSCTVSSGFSFCFQWAGQFCLWMGFRAISVRKAFLPCLCLDICPVIIITWIAVHLVKEQVNRITLHAHSCCCMGRAFA